ncbi:hypothetical protein CPAST_c07500 [Clostridium pasteurianum DSM 525 = ATCC 6013]|uniref:DUF2185 domain-containing protein n=1 Tax=Clostridium pasteurianum DSM 525 = ATCC 6013 TaxID=1262449 RepID=A0A0H3J794_CLOPA|nr:hypothetical protein [Clostridium pasteurianum]AJA46850.1 hypothetical protein CPAST_c07500 [Clostridium pasteurianum DSM 525 = ATCC 6013]AJA50838.1 hypothetical protein CLPA_c07500 [Clostridium pasteurianum DSM 525 = ATCC 6013]AOZ74239.1 hypothetical protein AQ983_03615 [Clostridium pasteurianum DSM 525 = ATCC 6013]AOZ78037.1 hypothetical protein AQ984_03615 [Clostridium pasteurianum]ELP58537.1 hypothetical protein F502_13685 [Clostridium pasteurianum DSM 525 = ATCC 6013]
MAISNWVFSDEPNVMVITTRNIINNINPILSVWHDEEDRMWQFLDGTDVNEEDAMIVSLEKIVDIDNSVEEVSNLPLGWVAWREQKGSAWREQKGSAWKKQRG